MEKIKLRSFLTTLFFPVMRVVRFDEETRRKMVKQTFQKKILGLIYCKGRDHKWGKWQYIKDGSCEQMKACQRCQQQELRTAIHVWGKWQYIKDDSCEQMKACQRCQQQELCTAIHFWGKWQYIKDDSCEQMKACQRCQQQELRTATHVWGKWQYIKDDSCEQMKACQRCQQQELHTATDFWGHVWGEEQYIKDGSCEQKKTCERCEQIQIQYKEKHHWKLVGYEEAGYDCSYNYPIAVFLEKFECERCGHSQDGSCVQSL